MARQDRHAADNKGKASTYRVETDWGARGGGGGWVVGGWMDG